jgi:hypothetical protein
MQRLSTAAAIFLLMNVCAYADGVYIYRAKPPAIPSQRALIVYKDGIERLQVESVVQSEGGSLAWILPIPATPTDIHEASPAFMKTLALSVEPKFVGPGTWRGTFMRAKFWAMLVLVWALIVFAFAPGRKALIPSLVLALLFFCAGRMLVGNFRGGADVGSATGVRQESTAVVGNYEVTALQASSADALNTWLTQNGFSALPAKGITIANNYINEGWHFVAAKLRTESGHLLRPHPLELAFPAKQPVYPMRLTALADCDVYVDLLVVANEAVRSDRLIREAVGKGQIQHSEAPRYLWSGCTVTRLSGPLRPDQMDKDLTLPVSPASMHQKTYYTPDANVRVSWTFAYWTWTLALGALVLAATLRNTRNRRRTAIALGLLITVPLAASVGLAVHALLPTRDAVLSDEPSRTAPTGHLLYDNEIWMALPQIAAANPGFDSLPPTEMASIVRAHFTYTPAFNSFTDEPLLFEESPGNIALENDAKGFSVKVYEQAGKAVVLDSVFFSTEGYRFSQGERFPLLDGNPDTLQRLFETWKSQRRRLFEAKPPAIDVMYAIARDPKRLAAPAIQTVEEFCAGREMLPSVLEVAVGALGLATHTVPPPDLSNHESMKAFLAQVKSRIPPDPPTPQ